SRHRSCNPASVSCRAGGEASRLPGTSLPETEMLHFVLHDTGIALLRSAWHDVCSLLRSRVQPQPWLRMQLGATHGDTEPGKSPRPACNVRLPSLLPSVKRRTSMTERDHDNDDELSTDRGVHLEEDFRIGSVPGHTGTVDISGGPGGST